MFVQKMSSGAGRPRSASGSGSISCGITISHVMCAPGSPYTGIAAKIPSASSTQEGSRMLHVPQVYAQTLYNIVPGGTGAPVACISCSHAGFIVCILRRLKPLSWCEPRSMTPGGFLRVHTPWPQSKLSHGSVSISQCCPVKPGLHVQLPRSDHVSQTPCPEQVSTGSQ